MHCQELGLGEEGGGGVVWVVGGVDVWLGDVGGWWAGVCVVRGRGGS